MGFKHKKRPKHFIVKFKNNVLGCCHTTKSYVTWQLIFDEEKIYVVFQFTSSIAILLKIQGE